jgi:hypothetical protein
MGYLLIGLLVSIALLLVIDHIAMMPTIVDNPKFRSKCRVCVWDYNRVFSYPNAMG